MSWFSPQTHASDSPADADTAHALVIDVRSPSEFAYGHVEGSINLPLDRFAQEIERIAPDKHADIVVCCASGGRSGMACGYMQRIGYQQVSNGGSADMVALQLGRRIARPA